MFYGQALDSFGGELEKVYTSIRSIREGNFLKALVREEIHQDQNWVVRLRMLPDAPETFYLTALMASHDFQTALHNYLDLEDLHRKLVTWQGSFDAFDDLIRLRRANYEPLLPDIDAQFRELDPFADEAASRAARPPSQAPSGHPHGTAARAPGHGGRAHRPRAHS